jgi:hypothetical protein
VDLTEFSHGAGVNFGLDREFCWKLRLRIFLELCRNWEFWCVGRVSLIGDLVRMALSWFRRWRFGSGGGDW